MKPGILLSFLLLAAEAVMAQPSAASAAHFLGILPCANCEALRVDLTLVADTRDAGSYEQRGRISARTQAGSRMARGRSKP